MGFLRFKGPTVAAACALLLVLPQPLGLVADAQCVNQMASSSCINARGANSCTANDVRVSGIGPRHMATRSCSHSTPRKCFRGVDAKIALTHTRARGSAEGRFGMNPTLIVLSAPRAVAYWRRWAYFQLRRNRFRQGSPSRQRAENTRWTNSSPLFAVGVVICGCLSGQLYYRSAHDATNLPRSWLYFGLFQTLTALSGNSSPWM